MEKRNVSRQEIVEGLKSLGITEGDKILVHSSLSRIGLVDGGAETVIDALLEAVGKSGTVVMPSFQAGGEHALLRDGVVFDLRTSPCGLGKIPETFRRRKDAKRSISPTHSVAAIGPEAASLIDGHQYCNVSVGHGTPFEKLCQQGGKILQLGVTHGSNTTLHYVENVNGAPTVCREIYEPLVLDFDGKAWMVPTHPHMPGLGRNYPRVEEELLEQGIQKSGQVGMADSHLLDAGRMAAAIGTHIKSDPTYLIDVFTP